MELFEKFKNLGWKDEDIPLATEYEIQILEKNYKLSYLILTNLLQKIF